MKTLLLAGSLAASMIFAQEPPPAATKMVTAFQGMTYEYVTKELKGPVVKGAPYSADAVTEIMQTLADGNRIHRTISSHIARDSQGRTRREQAVEPLGNPAPGEQGPKITTIDDPVAGENYVLNEREHTARKLNVTRNFEVRTTAGFSVQSSEGKAANERLMNEKLKAEARQRNQNVKKESLGAQMIEGVSAEGTRVTTTIPAGQVGNERPIEIVDERWYSPDLQTVVMTRHSDPRSGETVYKLTNLDRSEPDPTLFQVPADYRVFEAK
jgi:hypothetical protein